MKQQQSHLKKKIRASICLNVFFVFLIKKKNQCIIHNGYRSKSTGLGETKENHLLCNGEIKKKLFHIPIRKCIVSFIYYIVFFLHYVATHNSYI